MPETAPIAVLRFDPELGARKRTSLLIAAWVLRSIGVVPLVVAWYQSWWGLIAVTLVIGVVAEIFLSLRKVVGRSAGQPCVAVTHEGITVSSVGLETTYANVPWDEIASIVVLRYQSTLRPRFDVAEPGVDDALPEGGLFYSARSINLAVRNPGKFSSLGALAAREVLGTPRDTKSISVNTRGAATGEAFHAFLLVLAAEANRRAIPVVPAKPVLAKPTRKPSPVTSSIGFLADRASPPDRRRWWPLIAFLVALVAIVVYVVWAALLLKWYLLILIAIPFAIGVVAVIRSAVSRIRYAPTPAIALSAEGITTPQITVPWPDIESLVVLVHPNPSLRWSAAGRSIADTIPTGQLLAGARSILMVVRDPDGFKRRVGPRLGLLVRPGLDGVAEGKKAIPCDTRTIAASLLEFYEFIETLDAECARRGIAVTAC